MSIDEEKCLTMSMQNCSKSFLFASMCSACSQMLKRCIMLKKSFWYTIPSYCHSLPSGVVESNMKLRALKQSDRIPLPFFSAIYCSCLMSHSFTSAVINAWSLLSALFILINESEYDFDISPNICRIVSSLDLCGTKCAIPLFPSYD